MMSLLAKRKQKEYLIFSTGTNRYAELSYCLICL